MSQMERADGRYLSRSNQELSTSRERTPEEGNAPFSTTSRPGSEGGSPPSSAFLTPGSGSSDSVTETADYQTPVPVIQFHDKDAARLLKGEAVDLSLVTRRPLRSVPPWDQERESQASDVKDPHPRPKAQFLLAAPADRELSQFEQGVETSSKSTNSSQSRSGDPPYYAYPNWHTVGLAKTLPPPTVHGSKKEKSSSPSGLSQSSIISGMEWDPSADLDLAHVNYRQHHPPPVVTNKSDESGSFSLGTVPPSPPGHVDEGKRSVSEEGSGTQVVSSRTVLEPEPPASSSRSWRDSVSVEITLDPTTRTAHAHPRSKSELGNHPLLIVDRGVQTGRSINSLQSNSRHSNAERKSNQTRLHSHRESQPLHPIAHVPRSWSAGARVSSDETCCSSGDVSQLTATCSFIKHLTGSGAQVTDPTLHKAILTHRREHIENVKRELRRVQALSQLLCGPRSENSTLSSSKSSSELCERSHLESTPKPRPNHHRHKSRSQPSAIQSQSAIMMPLPRTKRDCESKNTSSASSAEPLLNLESQKAEEILKAFRLMLENLVPGAAISHPSNRSSTSDSPRLPNHADTSGIKQRTKCPSSVKAPVGYFLALPSRKGNRRTLTLHKGRNHDTSASDKENEETDLEDELEESLSRIKLQEILEEKNARFLKRANERRKHLALVREVRQKRALMTRNWIAKHGIKDMSLLESALPPKVPRLMSPKEMRKQTERKVVNLPENVEKKLRRKAEEEKETNRQLSSYFSMKLSRGVLKGKVNVGINRSVIRN